jgi:glycerophosphoryl diester phosphodiesterase
MMLHPYLNTHAPLAFAHRGGAGDWPENTMEAFTGAYKLGFRYLETDVHLASDGTIVAFHDAELGRVSEMKGRIAQLRWSEIQSIRVTNGGNGAGRIPTMQELLIRFPDAKFNIDMKSDEVVLPLLKLIKDHRAFDRVCLASFYDRRIKQVATLSGEKCCTSAGRLATARSVFRGVGLSLPPSKSPVLQVPLYRYGVKVITQEFIDRAHKDGKKVHVWTIDDPQQIHWLLDIGVDGIMTDKPRVLKQVFVERNIWPG